MLPDAEKIVLVMNNPNTHHTASLDDEEVITRSRH